MMHMLVQRGNSLWPISWKPKEEALSSNSKKIQCHIGRNGNASPCVSNNAKSARATGKETGNTTAQQDSFFDYRWWVEYTQKEHNDETGQ